MDASIEQAAAADDFVRVGALVRNLGLAHRDSKRLSRLAHIGNVLLTLDLEDLVRAKTGQVDLDAALHAVSLPQTPSPQPAGLLASLLPTAALLIDVIEVRHQQHQVSQLLAAVHLLNEVLPLLAWEDILGHAGDPTQLLRQVTMVGSQWGQPLCPTTGPGGRAARKLKGAVRTPAAWQEFLERSWSLLGAQLTDCAGCRTPCSVAALAQDHRGTLNHRLSISQVFARSCLLGERHGSAVGHAFAVPDAEEVRQSWRLTRAQLTPLAPRVTEDDGRSLPGLGTMIEAVAGRPLPPRSVLHQVKEALDLGLRQLDLIQPSALATTETTGLEPTGGFGASGRGGLRGLAHSAAHNYTQSASSTAATP